MCAGDPIDGDLVLELLARLVARSLVDAVDGPGTRYRLLEPIRQYAEERRADVGETDRLRRRHAEYFTEFAGAARSHLWAGRAKSSGVRGSLRERRQPARGDGPCARHPERRPRVRALLPPPQSIHAFQVHDLVVFDPAALLALPGAAEHPGPSRRALGRRQ